MPQPGSSTLMIGVGQLQVLQTFAAALPVKNVSVQQVVLTLLDRERPPFIPSVEVDEAIAFIDWLSRNEEFALTVSDWVCRRVSQESTTLCEIAWKFYKNGGKKRKKLPAYYRNGLFLLTLIGRDYIVRWAHEHPKFTDFQVVARVSNSEMASRNETLLAAGRQA